MNKMREEFSKHCQLWRYSEEVDENDFFVNATTQRAWDVWATAWQASRAALVVDINHNRKFLSKNEVLQKLDAAGVKYK